MNERLTKLQRKLGLQFQNPQLLQQAMTHRSVSAGNNERLEYLGDSVLGFVIAQALYLKFPQANEGQLTRLRAALVKRDTLAELADSFDFEDFLILGQGELKTGGAKRASIRADAFEAIIGAIEQDIGFEAAKAFILKVYQEKLNNLSLDDVQKDPKTLLQEYLQGRNEALPIYTVTAIRGDSHDQIFTVSCEVVGLKEKIVGEEKSRRRAEQVAAAVALQQIMQGKK